MINFRQATLLEIVEAYALDNDLISSEAECSERFDSEALNAVIEQYGVKGQAFNDDAAISEAFSFFTDSKEKSGELHREQVKNYDYVGSHSV